MWRYIESAPEYIAVMTKIHDNKGCRNEQVMIRKGNLWFVGEMYVYYCPTPWKEIECPTH